MRTSEIVISSDISLRVALGSAMDACSDSSSALPFLSDSGLAQLAEVALATVPW